MRYVALVLYFWTNLAFAAPLASPNVVVTPPVKPEDSWHSRPAVTKTCVAYSPSGNCNSYVNTYTVAGASCTEDCLAFGEFDRCHLSNRCAWDRASGCFKKTTCIKIGDFDRCEQWDEAVICAS